jgi:DNA replication protein DnaC
MTKAKAGERLPYLLSKLKAPRVLERLEQTAVLAREQGWPYERFLETLLEAEVFARDASGARMRVRAAGFPALKSLEDFDWSAQPSAERPLVLHLAQLAWIEEAGNVCFLGPPGTGKTHLATALALKACERGYRVAFATAQEWVSRLEAAQDRNQLEAELRRLERYHLLSSTRSATCRSNGKPPTCSSHWSRAATNAARSSSPATAASSNGARSSATPWSPPP